MNNSLSAIVITSTAERKVEGYLELILVAERGDSSGRELHTKEECRVPSTRIVCLTIKDIVDNLGRKEDGTFSQIRSNETRSHLVL